jgi:hypothetical protein
VGSSDKCTSLPFYSADTIKEFYSTGPGFTCHQIIFSQTLVKKGASLNFHDTADRRQVFAVHNFADVAKFFLPF